MSDPSVAMPASEEVVPFMLLLCLRAQNPVTYRCCVVAGSSIVARQEWGSPTRELNLPGLQQRIFRMKYKYQMLMQVVKKLDEAFCALLFDVYVSILCMFPYR